MRKMLPFWVMRAKYTRIEGLAKDNSEVSMLGKYRWRRYLHNVRIMDMNLEQLKVHKSLW
jgi:hypothetical protein